MNLLAQCGENCQVPLAETVLRDAAKSLGTLLSGPDRVDAEIVKNLLDALTRTADTSNLSTTHRVAACNVLCGTIEQCVQGNDPDLTDLVFASETLDGLFRIYIDHYDNGKSKAMKQVLSTIVKLLGKAPAAQIADIITSRCLDLALKERDRSRAKPALHALTIFLSRNVLSVSHLVVLYGCVLTQHDPKSVEEIINHYQADFISNLLAWIPVGDIAPTAGQLLSAVAAVSLGQLPTSSDNTVPPPVWADPLLRGIETSPDAIQAYRYHAFPALFQSGVQVYVRFLEYLDFRRLLGLAAVDSTNNDEPSSNGEIRRLVLLSALQAGKISGLVQECSLQTSSQAVVRDQVLLLPDSVLGHLCAQASHAARLAGLSLLVSSASATRPLTFGTLTTLQSHLPHMFADVDANFRGEVHSHFQALINRLRSILAVLARQRVKPMHENTARTFTHDAAKTNNVQSQQEAEDIHANHMSFIAWICGFVTSELVTTAAYQRHISALKALITLLRSGLDSDVANADLSKSARGDVRWPVQMSVVTPATLRALLDLLLDPFDDVRQAALENLLIVQTASCRNGPATIARMEAIGVQKTLIRAREIMLKSGRVDQADGVARLYSLTVHRHLVSTELGTSAIDNSTWDVIEGLASDLEAALSVALKDLTLAVQRYPIHGLFTATRYALEQLLGSASRGDEQKFEKLLSRLELTLLHTWRSVRHLLCNDAPEGFMPEDMEEDASLTTRDVLSYAWRGLKESSLLLRTLASPACAALIRREYHDRTIQKLGGLCFTQLAELRHRGAFSTVAQTFAYVCAESATSANPQVARMIDDSYDTILRLFQQKGTAITRRSAGLPAIVVGLIASDASGKLYSRAISDLTVLSEVEPVMEDNEAVDLPQVHALNTIRAIFITSRLASRSEKTIVEAMRLAAKCLTSKIWAIRNCGLMLFRSLIDRLLGSNESSDDFFENAIGNATRLSYDKHPGLLELIVYLLRSSDAIIGPGDDPTDKKATFTAEAVFLVLDLLRRAPPPPSIRDEIFHLVVRALGNSSWHVRAIAAHTAASITPVSQVSPQITSLLSQTTCDRNELHGRLMCLTHMSKAAIRAAPTQHTASKTQSSLTDLAPASDLSDHAKTGSHTGVETILDLFRDDHELFKQCILHVSDDTIMAEYLEILCLVGVRLLQYGATADLGPGSTLTDLAERFADVSKTILCRPEVDEGRRGSVLLRMKLLKLAWLAHLLRPTATGPTWTLLLTNTDNSAVVDTLKQLQSLLCALPLKVSWDFLACLLASVDVGRSRVEACLYRSILDVVAQVQPFEVQECHDLVAVLSELDIAGSIQASSSPVEFQSSLSLWGHVLACRYLQQRGWTSEVLADVQIWLRLCVESLKDDNEYPLRIAAVSSLHGLQLARDDIELLPEDSQVKYCLTIYDCLLDDDEDVRAIGARIAVEIVKGLDVVTESDDVVSDVAAHMLASHMSRAYSSSATLASGCCKRILGHHVDPQMISAEKLLKRALQADTTLFGEEKQNLYLDEIKEAQLWSQVLQSMGEGAYIQGPADVLSLWAAEGIECLTTQAEVEEDGALGWATNPEVLTLGMRVLCTTDVLLGWSAAQKVDLDRSALTERLQRLASVGKQADLPGLWMQTIGQILTSSSSDS